MKKFLKIFLIIPIFIFAMISMAACGEEKMTGISLSIPNCTYTTGYYYVNQSTSRLSEMEVKIRPSSFSVDDLTFETSDSSIATVYNNRYIVARGTGDVVISAWYKNADGSTVRASIKIKVMASSDEAAFSQTVYATSYTGQALQDNYKILQDDNTGRYSYTYYDITNSNYVDTIVETGDYQIICRAKDSEVVLSSATLTVQKADLTLTASNVEITYGDDLPGDIYTAENRPANFLQNNKIGLSVYGKGREASTIIGQYVKYIEGSGQTSGQYLIHYYFEILDKYANLYNKNLVVNDSYLKVLSKHVVLGVNNQEIYYGESIVPNSVNLYSYDDYVSHDNSLEGVAPLSNEKVNYMSNIYLDNVSFELNGVTATKNAAGYLDVLLGEGQNEYGTYDICYNNARTINGNVYLEKMDVNGTKKSIIVSGALKILPRNVAVLPRASQTKIYTDADPETFTYDVTNGSFLNYDTVNKFLRVDYSKLDYELGEGNYLAGAGKYYYAVDNTKNQNYNITLNSQAVSENGVDIDNKVYFEVTPCPIVIELNDLTVYYQTPNERVDNNTSIHTLSYYDFIDSSTPNYVTTLKSVVINGEEVLDNPVGKAGENTLSSDCQTTGDILLKGGGSFKFKLSLASTLNNKGNHYMTYATSLHTISFSDGVDAKQNYDVSFVSSYLYLDKIVLTIVPSLTASLVSKIYDAKENDNGLLAGFGADYRVKDGALENGITIEDILVNYASVLTLRNENSNYEYLQPDGTYLEVSKFKDCGQYKINLSTVLQYKAGREYYDFVLDGTKDYLFTVSPYSVIVTPSNGQSKTYAEADPELVYVHSTMPESDVAVSGGLSREVGENVGSYKIGLGSLSYGENYNLILNPNQDVYFVITPRDVYVTPNSYITTYGETYPTTLGYVERISGEYESNLLTAPVFSGAFAVDGTRVDSFYPVKLDEEGNVISYGISQGTFTVNPNYTIVFDTTATYTVNKRSCLVNIAAQQIDNVTVNTSLTLDSGRYSVLNLVSGTTSKLDVELASHSSYYSVETYTLTLTENGIDVSNCYDVSLGKKIVYNINVTVIELAIRDLSEISNTVSVAYTGREVSNNFVLVCQTEGYSIDASSNYNFIYTNGAEPILTPRDVGSYVVSINTSIANFKIVIKDEKASDDSPNKYIIFEDLEGEVVNNYILNVSNHADLNITRANINYVAGELAFEEEFIYSSPALYSKLKTTYKLDGVDTPIFTGVDGEAIKLRNFTIEDKTLNFSYSGASYYSLSSFEASRTYPISVTVQAIKTVDGREVVDSNYNSLTITVMLSVKPKTIVVTSAQFVDARGEDANVVGPSTQFSYDGVTKAVYLRLGAQDTSDLLRTSTSYRYTKFKMDYRASVNGELVYFNLKNGVVDIESGSFTMPLSSIGSFREVLETSYLGTSYVIINDKALIVEQTNNYNPVDAGIYLCFSVVEAEQNYVLATSSNPDEQKSYLDYAMLYEVAKSSDIEITNWKDTFYYTTTFNMSNPSTLPFDYTMSPNFKDSVQYSMDLDSWPANYVLGFGEYTVTLTVNTSNYFKKFDMGFSVEKLDVEFIFPTLVTYIYVSDTTPIVSFLSSIRIVQKDKDGNSVNSFYYVAGDANSSLVSVVIRDVDRDYTYPENTYPSLVGNYELKAYYGKSSSGETNYYGEGVYNYSIIKKAYSGEISFVSTTIAYNPDYTEEYVYNIILSRMFTIGLSSGYTAKFYDEDRYSSSNPDPSEIAVGVEKNPNWLSRINSYGTHTIRLVVTFDDGITMDYTTTSLLNISKFALPQNSFSTSSTASEIDYTGYRILNTIIFNDILLDLYVNTTSSPVEKTYQDGTYRTVAQGYKITVYDKLDNAIFVLEYKYLQNVGGYFSALSQAPISPNPAQEEYYYRVTYNFEFGRNYSSSSYPEYKDFRINKISTLYIAVDTGNNEQIYNGDNLTSAFLNNMKFTVRNTLNTTESNMKFSIFTSTSGTYTDDRGVAIYAMFKDTEDTQLTRIIDAGSYKVGISLWLFGGNSYILSDYFDKVNLSGTEYPVAQFGLDANGEVPASLIIERSLTVKKAQLNLDWQAVLGTYITMSNGSYDPLEDVYNGFTGVKMSLTNAALSTSGITVRVKFGLSEASVGEDGYTISSAEHYQILINRSERYSKNYEDATLILDVKDPKYKIIFKCDESAYHIIETAGNEIIQLPADPSMDGYTFEGWYFDKDVWVEKLTTITYENGRLTSDVTVYAKFVKIEDPDVGEDPSEDPGEGTGEGPGDAE